MMLIRPTADVRWAPVYLVSLLGALSTAMAFQVPQEPSRFDALVIADPSATVAPASLSAEALAAADPAGAAWRAFRDAHGQKWDIVLDGRSGAPLLVEGQGIPFIAGSGNGLAASGPVTLDALAGSVRAFAARYSSMLHTSDAELVLNREGSGDVTPELWQIAFERVVSGVPVTGDRYVFYIGHGNLMAFGASRWSAVTTSPVPALTAEQARARLYAYMGLTGAEPITLYEAGALAFTPMAAPGTSPESYAGAVGSGYRAALTWKVALAVGGEPGSWVGLVDAHSGAILAFYDDIKYAQVKGGVFPLSDDGICPSGCEQAGYPMPFANLTVNGSPATANSLGTFTCGGGNAVTTLAAPYVKVVDTCGAISQSVACDADLNLGTSSGTDCTVPAGASAGDTHASRTGFYHLNRIKEHARAWLPTNTWLTQQLTDNVNLNNTCNAFWSPGAGTVNFYRSGGGCRNSGEISGVFLHEWGHGLDQNDGGGNDSPGEAYADITSFLVTHASCIGRGFFQSGTCSGYGNACTTCTGIRDVDYAKRAANAPSTPSGFVTSNCGTGVTRGPCNREAHCESYVSTEAVWDLAARDLTAMGLDQNSAWQLTDKLWYKSRLNSGGNAYTCTLPTSNGCASTSWFTKLRTIDDDDGNLTNGTPHAAAIFAAFNRHAIACGAAGDASNQNASSCPALGTPVLSAAPGPNTVSLTWTAAANAASYNILRNDTSCTDGYTLVATTAGTSYNDTGLANGFTEYYTVQAVGSNSACMGALSNCQAVAPVNVPPSADLFTTKSDSPDPVVAGQNITYSVSVGNLGPNAASSVSLSDATPVNTTFQSITPAPGWFCSTPPVGGTGAISCTIATLNASASSSFTIVVKVNFCVGNGTVITNTATASSSTTDPVPGNNAATATTTVSDPGTCSDGNACTQTDTCSGGVCVGSNPVLCAASDQCHDVGVCNSGTGVCSNPAKVNGFACNDGNACTQTDTCQSGTCTGSNPVVCVASDQCHNVGVCNTGTGVCTNPAKPDGSACNDGNACTQVDACKTGACMGNSPVVCTASDQCHDAGVCNTGTGVCTNPAKPDGTACNDGNACTQTDTCQSGVCSGSNPIVCTASDQCHDVGTCNPGTGVCSNPAKTNGTACSDGNACTQNDSCQAGTCTGNPVVCIPSDQCHDAGVCNTGTGVCSDPAAADGTPCNDHNACTQTDTCQSEACTGTNPVVCAPSDQCHDAGTCDTVTGACSNPAKQDGTACSDGNACTQTDTCQAGACTGSNSVVCTPSDQCHDAGACDTVTGACSNPAKPDSSPCSDGNPCTVGDACTGAACVSGAAVPPPSEVSDTVLVSQALGGASIAWTEVPGSFGVYRGSLAAGAAWAYNQACLGVMASSPATDAAAPPAPDGLYFYLVSRRDACGESVAGRNSDGVPDPTPSPCP